MRKRIHAVTLVLGLLLFACGEGNAPDEPAAVGADVAAEDAPAADAVESEDDPSEGSSEGSSEAGASEAQVTSDEFSRPPTAAPQTPEISAACTPEGSPTIAAIQERGSLNWAIGISPPFGFKDAQGEYVGVEVDNAAELAGILGVEASIADYDYGALPPALTTGRADIVGAQLFITPERDAVIDFADPYYVSGQLFYVLEDSPWQTIEDLDSPDNRFVYGTGNAQGPLAEGLIGEADIFDAPLRGQVLLYEFLVAGRADSSMVEAQLMKPLLSQYTDPQLAAVGLQGRVESERATEADLIEPFDVAFGVAPGDEGWTECLNAWVADMTETGRMQERIEYWLSEISG